jgi:hypothetical protein
VAQNGTPIALSEGEVEVVNREREMTAKQNQFMIVPVALIVGGALFAVGHSMRPAAIQAPGVTANAIGTPAIVVPRAGTVATASEATLFAAQQVAAADQPQIHTGIIVSMNGDRLILRDDDNGTWYHLDNQQAASSYLGKKVRVNGEIDPATDVIHVQSIEEEKV